MMNFFEDIDTQIAAELKGRCVLGVTVCVRVGDDKAGVLYLNAHKNSDAGIEAVINKDDLFLIASQSKTFTAVAALLLIESEYLTLDEKLIDLLPDLKKHPDHLRLADITVKDLLQHRAPLNWQLEMYDQWDMGKSYPTVAEISGPNLFPMLDSYRLHNEIGVSNYSNPSYALLGAIIERIAVKNNLGSSFGDFVQKHLLARNELDVIYPGLSEEEISAANNIVPGYYMFTDGTLKRSLMPSVLACTPSAGFYGTAEQVSKFYHRLMTGNIFTEKSLEMMKEYAKIVSPGMGLNRYDDGSLGHDGVMTGYESRTVHRDWVTITILSNLCTLSNSLEPNRIDYASLGEPPWLPEIVTIVRSAIAKHFPDQKWTPECPIPKGKPIEDSKPDP